MRRQAAGECGFVKAYRKRIFRLMRELIELTSAEVLSSLESQQKMNLRQRL
jgi:hypothetical protein